MRIAHVVATFPPRMGGMGKVAYDECKKLAKHGLDVTVFSLEYHELCEPESDFSIVHLNPWIRGGDAGWVPQLYSKLSGFDVVHLHYPWYGGAEWVLLARLFKRQKYVVTYHMDARPTKLYQRIVQRVYDAFLAGSILSQAEKIFVVDKEHFSQSRFGKILKSEKVVELGNAVDVEMFSQSGEALQPEKYGLLFVANLLPVKRLDLLLDALAQLPDVVLTVVGEGYDEIFYRNKVVELKLDKRVIFAGEQAPKNLARYYHKAFATVIPSDAESFSLVALESQASGTPVIVSDIPGARGRVRHGVDGFLFKPGSVEDLVTTIKKMMQLSSEERRKMGEAGRDKVRQEYSLEKHVEKLEATYKSI